MARMIDGQRHESKYPSPTGVQRLAVTTTHTLADLNTLFIPREGSPPVSFCSRNRRGEGPPSSSSYTWLMSRGHPRCPNFYRLSRCFDPFPPPLDEGLNDFMNHPLSFFPLPFSFLSSVLFEYFLLRFFLSRGKNTRRAGRWKVGDAKL